MIRLNVVILRRRKILLWIGIVMGVLLSPCLALLFTTLLKLKPDNWLFGRIVIGVGVAHTLVYIPGCSVSRSQGIPEQSERAADTTKVTSRASLSTAPSLASM